MNHCPECGNEVPAGYNCEGDQEKDPPDPCKNPTQDEVPEVKKLRQERDRLAESIKKIIPYVTATLQGYRNQSCENEEWYPVHRGRAGSSTRQLEQLLEEAEEILE